MPRGAVALVASGDLANLVTRHLENSAGSLPTMDSKYKAIATRFGSVDSRFLSRDLSVLDPPPPITLSDKVTVRETIECLKKYKIGCVLAVNDAGKLTGVFSERDVVSKVSLTALDLDRTPLSKVMTADPHTETLETSIAFALQQMSDGGYRHIPVVDDDNFPIGIISVKDILDFIKQELIAQLVASELGETDD